MPFPEPGGHIDQLIRQTRAHHVQLSSMADLKANMVLTMASVVLTLCIRYLTDPRLFWPSMTLMGFCFVTIALAAYAAMPKVHTRAEDSEHHLTPTNLLFFGDFAHLTWEQYRDRMEEVLAKPGQVYEIQLKEVYTLGLFLEKKKYRYLRLAYVSFLLGVAVAGIVFAVIEIAG